MNDAIMITTAASVIVFIMFAVLCYNVAKIKNHLSLIAEYTKIKAKREGIKQHGD